MGGRVITRLRLLASARQVDAHEIGLLRYVGYLLATVGLSWLAITQAAVAVEDAFFVVVGAALIGLLLFRPWHRVINVDLDTEVCRVERRLLGLLSFDRSRFEIGERRFAVEKRYWAAESVGSTGLGCAMMALPFPFSMLAWLANDGDKTEVTHRGQFVLCLRGSEESSVEDLLTISDPKVVTKLLEALSDLLGDRAE